MHRQAFFQLGSNILAGEKLGYKILWGNGFINTTKANCIVYILASPGSSANDAGPCKLKNFDPVHNGRRNQKPAGLLGFNNNSHREWVWDLHIS